MLKNVQIACDVICSCILNTSSTYSKYKLCFTKEKYLEQAESTQSLHEYSIVL